VDEYVADLQAAVADARAGGRADEGFEARYS
jgi:hypothetical protein